MALPFPQLVSIAHQLERRPVRVAAIEEPRELDHGAAQVCVPVGCEELLVRGMTTAMVASIRRHASVTRVVTWSMSVGTPCCTARRLSSRGTALYVKISPCKDLPPPGLYPTAAEYSEGP